MGPLSSLRAFKLSKLSSGLPDLGMGFEREVARSQIRLLWKVNTPQVSEAGQQAIAQAKKNKRPYTTAWQWFQQSGLKKKGRVIIQGTQTADRF